MKNYLLIENFKNSRLLLMLFYNHINKEFS